MRKLRLLWIVWLAVAVANLLFINVYLNHLGTAGADGSMSLSNYQQLGYLGLSLIMLLLTGVWWIAIGKSRGGKVRVVLGAILTIVAGLALIATVVYALVIDKGLLGTIINKLAEWFSFLKF